MSLSGQTKLFFTGVNVVSDMGIQLAMDAAADLYDSASAQDLHEIFVPAAVVTVGCLLSLYLIRDIKQGMKVGTSALTLYTTLTSNLMVNLGSKFFQVNGTLASATKGALTGVVTSLTTFATHRTTPIPKPLSAKEQKNLRRNLADKAKPKKQSRKLKQRLKASSTRGYNSLDKNDQSPEQDPSKEALALDVRAGEADTPGVEEQRDAASSDAQESGEQKIAEQNVGVEKSGEIGGAENSARRQTIAGTGTPRQPSLAEHRNRGSLAVSTKALAASPSLISSGRRDTALVAVDLMRTAQRQGYEGVEEEVEADVAPAMEIPEAESAGDSLLPAASPSSDSHQHRFG